MKLMNLRHHIAAAIVAAGVCIGGVAHGQNLVMNGDFEAVDISSSMGGYDAVLLLDWTAPTGGGYAYSHDGSLNAAGDPIPDYANGGPLAGGGSFYFTPNANNPDNDDTNAVYQDIDLSRFADEIATGTARFRLSAYFSSYAMQGDLGSVKVEFIGDVGAVLDSTTISDTDPTAWSQESTWGMVPVGSLAARVSAFGDAVSGGPDGYIDNVDFRIVPEPAGFGISALGLAGLMGWRRRRQSTEASG